MNRIIGLNLQPLALPSLTGIGTYTLEVVKRLPAALGSQYACEAHVFDFLGRNHAAAGIASYFDRQEIPPDTGLHIPVRTCRLFPLGAYIRAGVLGRIVSYQQLLHSKADTTVFFNYLRPDRVSGKSIITVYDMVCERFPETMNKRNKKLLRRFLAKSCRNADAIITISEFSKQEITACLGIPPEKIHVALCGIDRNSYFPPEDEEEREHIREYLLEKYKITSPYIFYLGTLEPRKNVDVLLDAFSALHVRYPELKLVICGGLGWQYEHTLSHLASLGLDDAIIRTGYIPDEDKRPLYAGAEVFVFPSVYEGFGLPAAEAMACGTPVVCSRASSLPEVVGDAGILCDPYDTDAFVSAIEKLYTDIPLRNLYRARQEEQIRPFNWDGTAQIYGQVIADVVKSHR